MSTVIPMVKPRSLNRQKGFLTPTESDTKCPHFMDRFIGWGTLNEKRGICEKDDDNVTCSYRYVTTDGTPMCLRYWYGPKYELVEDVEEVYIQKKDSAGNLVYKNPDGTETLEVTNTRAMVPLREERPVPYIQDTMAPDDTGTMQPTHPEFFSTQYEDTHEKVYDVNGNIGWHKKV